MTLRIILCHTANYRRSSTICDACTHAAPAHGLLVHAHMHVLRLLPLCISLHICLRATPLCLCPCPRVSPSLLLIPKELKADAPRKPTVRVAVLTAQWPLHRAPINAGVTPQWMWSRRRQHFNNANWDILWSSCLLLGSD